MTSAQNSLLSPLLSSTIPIGLCSLSCPQTRELCNPGWKMFDIEEWHLYDLLLTTVIAAVEGSEVAMPFARPWTQKRN